MTEKKYSFEELVDRKILFINTAVNKFIVHEGKVNEFSPAGKCIKINHEWHLLDRIVILELFTKEERPGLKFV